MRGPAIPQRGHSIVGNLHIIKQQRIPLSPEAAYLTVKYSGLYFIPFKVKLSGYMGRINPLN